MTDEQPQPVTLQARLFRLLGLAIIAASLIGGWFLWDYQTFTQSPLKLSEDSATFSVEKGDSLRRVAERLQSQGVIEHPLYLRILGRQTGLASQLKVGEYQLTNSMKPGALLEHLASGKVIQYPFTIIEGWNFRELRAALADAEALQHLTTDWDEQRLMAELGEPELHPEGQFLPDTYHFPRGTTDLEFLQRAHQSLQATLTKAWEGRADNLPFRTPYEALTLASIVEKETGVPEERPMIAGVFVLRLEKGMRLQTDPTVIYGMGEAYDGDIRFRDLRRDTPYNTYTRGGLPPTPIAMPGRAAIEAVMHPVDGKALYFVARGDGSHHFSATLAEHNKAVRKYQLKR